MKENKEHREFEENLQELQQLVATMEKGDTPLADMLSMHKQAHQLITVCQQQLDVASEQLEQVNKQK